MFKKSAPKKVVRSGRKVVVRKSAPRRVTAPKYDEPKLSKRERKEAAALVDGKKRRLAAAARIKRTLENYPTNPKVGTRKMADKVSNRSKKAQDKHPNQVRAEKKAARLSARAEKKAARLAARLEKKAAREQVKAERQALREQRKAERIEKRKMANMPAVRLSPRQSENILLDVQEQFGLTDKVAARQKKLLEKIAKLPPTRLKNQMKRVSIKLALMTAVIELVKEALKDVPDEPTAKSTKSAKSAKRTNGSIGRTSAGEPDAASKAKRARAHKEEAAAYGAKLATKGFISKKAVRGKK